MREKFIILHKEDIVGFKVDSTEKGEIVIIYLKGFNLDGVKITEIWITSDAIPKISEILEHARLVSIRREVTNLLKP